MELVILQPLLFPVTGLPHTQGIQGNSGNFDSLFLIQGNSGQFWFF